MRNIYEKTKDIIKLEKNVKIIYQYLLNDESFGEEIASKISPQPLTQKDLEILLYSLRFVFNTKENNNNFYNNLLKPNVTEYINNNYIPGSFQYISEYYRSYFALEDKLKQRLKIGYYICKDCGFLYEIEDCTFPMEEFNCVNGHIIGGDDHICSKKDLRVFYDQAEYNLLKETWPFPEMNDWFNSFEPIIGLDEFKEKYVNKNIPKIEKGIIKNYESKNFENLDFVRDINIITFRVLNIILYSYLLGSNIIKSLSNEDTQNYIIQGYDPNLFSVIKKNWELLFIPLKEKGIENIQVFMNMIFDKVIEMINNLDSVDSIEKLNAFENQVNEYIINIISNKENVEKLNQDYISLNKELINSSPYSIKEIIKSSFEPSNYDQNVYPDIQYYSVSSLQNFESFVNKFNSEKENRDKYFLINLLLQKDEEMTKDTLNLKAIENLNKLGNILINIFSYKISREDAIKVTLSEKLEEITSLYSRIEQNENYKKEEFIKTFIEPFIQSWNKIKYKSIKYKCHDLNNKQPFDMKLENNLSNFLTDNGDEDGGMFLASAYENLINWQNKIINIIIEKNKKEGIHNSYVSQIEKKISIQEATENDIIKIDENTYSYLEELINNCSMRNIFTNEGKIYYKNYADNIYDYEYIEQELGKKILTGIKKFKVDDIKFIIYKYEEFRGDKSSILIKFIEKYPKKELSKEEKEVLNDLVKNNNNIYKDISSSLQILMNQLIEDNYEPTELIYNIINNLPNYIILNEELRDVLRREYEYDKKTFSIDTLVSMYEYFESLCWKELKEHIAPDYKLDLSENAKQSVIEYFTINENNDKKIINKQNFTTALRRLISRKLISSRQEAEIKYDLKLSLAIENSEFWSNDVTKSEAYSQEIKDICNEEIKVCNSYNLYNILGGDNILKNELGIDIEEKDNTGGKKVPIGGNNQNGENGGPDGEGIPQDDPIYNSNDGDDDRSDEI